MSNRRFRLRRKGFVLIALAAVAAIPAVLRGQPREFQDALGLRKPKLADSPVEMSAALVRTATPGEVVLRISARLPPEYYLYSTNPAQGAATRITLSREDGLKAVDADFVADHEPKMMLDPDLKEEVEKFYDKVTWSRRYRIKPGSTEISAAGLVKYQVCDSNSCRQLKYPFDVQLAAGEPRAALFAPEQAATAAPDVSTRFEHKVGRKGQQTVGGTWSVSVAPRQAVPGDEVTVTVRAELQPKWHVYPLDLEAPEDGGSLPTVIGLDSGALVPVDATFAGPLPTEVLSAEDPTKTERYLEGTIEWTRKFRVPAQFAGTAIPLAGKVAWQMCNATGFCTLPTGFEFSGELAIGGTTEPDPAELMVVGALDTPDASEAIETLRLVKGPQAQGAEVASEQTAPPAAAPLGAEGGAAAKLEIGSGGPASRGIDRSQGLFVFLLAAAGFGFAALLTPCVFPMIPITVSFFQKQSEKEHHRPVTMALVYCLGIVGTFTGLGMLMSVVFSATAITQLANNVVLNVFLGGVLVFFGFNLLGLFELRMPSWLLTYTAGQESRGGFIGVLFMSLTFTLTSFTCTFAFAGLLLVAAQKGDRLWPILGLLAFSAAFSLPFFFLALFPSFLQKLPKSGGWMNVVKVIMGLIELGAAFKFFGTADQTWNGQAAIFDFHLMVSAWAVISIAAALYLLGLFRLSHDMPADHIGVVRFVSAMSFMGLAAYLGVGLFSTEKPQGMVWKYVEAFATPQFKGGTDPTGPYLEHGGLKYALDFEKAFEFAVAEKKPLFLDFTGVNCTNCRYMEKGPMSQPAIEERLSRFVRVQLFTDSVPIDDKTEAERLRKFNVHLQEDWFGDVTLPSYVVIPPDPAILKNPGRWLAELTGKKDEAAFARFLDTGWKEYLATRGGRVIGQR